MRAFLISMAALVAITAVAALGLGAINMSAQSIYSTSDVRL